VPKRKRYTSFGIEEEDAKKELDKSEIVHSLHISHENSETEKSPQVPYLEALKKKAEL
jgi:hypothetical protein